ncbi:MAG: thioredoxin family protein [Saprospiraceae bacterium]|nr:thioredoxin family protein [Saprospiraceae bacterium]
MKNIIITLGIFFSLASFLNGQGYQIGQTAEDFSLKNVNEKMVSLADYKAAQGFVIVFTCNHCPYAKMYEKRIIDLHKKYEKKGYSVIAINPNDPEVVPEDSYAEMVKISKKKKYPFVYLLDEGQKVYPKFGATKTPHVYILDKNYVVKYIGAIDDNPKDESAVQIKYVENAIDALIKGTNPDPAVTKAIGCSVKKKA